VGDEPKRIRHLELAVQSEPNNDVARYLLGSTLRKKGELKRAMEVLYPVISSQFDKYLSFIEYTLCMLQAGEDLKKCVATLNLSRTIGLSDPRYIATLGGLYFLDHQFTEADKTFSERTKRNFTEEEVRQVHFQINDYGQPGRYGQFTGSVAEVRSGYSLIEVAGFPPILCPGTKYENLIMTKGLHIRFELGFSAKSAIAIRPKRIV
jgi:tetratricopeptide (TPR) repeat protein